MELEYTWLNKMLLTSNGRIIQLTDIKRLRIDNNDNQLAIKIYFGNRSLFLNSSNLSSIKADMPDFISTMEQIARNNSIKVVDHWQEWKEMGFLEIAHRINTILIYGGVGFLIYVIWSHGFTSHLLFYFIGALIPLFGYQQLMKSKK